jgi:hypothetical protein
MFEVKEITWKWCSQEKTWMGSIEGLYIRVRVKKLKSAWGISVSWDADHESTTGYVNHTPGAPLSESDLYKWRQQILGDLGGDVYYLLRRILKDDTYAGMTEGTFSGCPVSDCEDTDKAKSIKINLIWDNGVTAENSSQISQKIEVWGATGEVLNWVFHRDAIRIFSDPQLFAGTLDECKVEATRMLQDIVNACFKA